MGRRGPAREREGEPRDQTDLNNVPQSHTDFALYLSAMEAHAVNHRLEVIGLDDLAELITDAWRCLAPAKLVAEFDQR
jgi:hypothetical protein